MSVRHQVLLLLLAPAIAAIAAVLTVPFVPHDVTPQSFTIEPGWTLRTTLKRAAAAGAIRTPRFSEWTARIAGVAAPKAGRYTLPAFASDMDLIRRWHRGEVATVPVTIPEGWTAAEIAAALEKANILPASEFLAATRDTRLAQRYGIPASEVEGYLFPETYQFAPGLPATAAAAAMLETFFARLPADFGARATDVGLTPHQAVILASIIQAETYIPDEMPMVSAVYHNRLRKGMRLQADPTAIYRMPDYDGNLTRAHLGTRTPYNTYVIDGLPAGPIGNPGAAALAAAVSPATTDALFFVATGAGRHVFSRTYAEHQRNVERYQLRRR